MPKSSSKKSWIITICVIVVAVLAYFYITGGTSSSTGLLQSSASPDGSAVGTQVLNLLSQIKSLNIDTSLFQDPGYTTLRDYTVPIPQENVGRVNPFAPLPGEQVSGTNAPPSAQH